MDAETAKSAGATLQPMMTMLNDARDGGAGEKSGEDIRIDMLSSVDEPQPFKRSQLLKRRTRLSSLVGQDTNLTAVGSAATIEKHQRARLGLRGGPPVRAVPLQIW
jgi:hypothetical protein